MVGEKSYVLLIEGKTSEATALLEHAVAREPEEAGHWLMLGRAYEKASQEVNACRAYVRATKLGIGLPACAAVERLSCQDGGYCEQRIKELSAVVQSGKQGITACYESALRATLGRQDIDLRLTVIVRADKTGAIKNVSIEGPDFVGMNQCIQRAVESWQVPCAVAPAEFAFPLIFQRGF